MQLLLSVHAIVALLSGVTGLDTAGSIAAGVGARQCGIVQDIVYRLPSTAISSAQAFCNLYVTAKMQTVIVPGPTTTVRVAGICAAPSSPPQASKRAIDLDKRGFVRSPAAPCPTFLTALGTSILSKACSCLTQTVTTVTAPLSTITLTTYTPIVATTTTTFTATPAASTVYSTAISSRVRTSTSTSVVSTTSVSETVLSDTVYSTSTALSVATIVIPSPTATSTATYTTVLTSTQTVLTTVVVVTTSRVLQKRALSSALSVLTGCSTSTLTVSTTVIAPVPTIIVPVQSVNEQTTQQIDVSTITTTVTSTQLTTVTRPTTVTLPTTSTSISGYLASISTLITSSTTSTLTVSSTTTSTTLQPAFRTNLVTNPSFEASSNDLTGWSTTGNSQLGSDPRNAAAGNNYAMLPWNYDYYGQTLPTLSQGIGSSYLTDGAHVEFKYLFLSIGKESQGNQQISCTLSADWNGNNQRLGRFTTTVVSTGFNDGPRDSNGHLIYSTGSFDIRPSTVNYGNLIFYLVCSSQTYSYHATVLIDDVSLNVTVPFRSGP